MSIKEKWLDIVAPKSVESCIGGTQRQSERCKPSGFRRIKFKLCIDADQIELTYREAETLYFIASRHTVPETAILMGLSTRTVEFYVVNLRAKFRCRSKLELIQLIFEAGCLAKIRDYLS
jgi:DNA-binding CsgD family transcriptional regulator